MEMQLINFVDSLIPGDNELGAPKFSTVAWFQLQEETKLLKRVDVVIKDFRNNVTASVSNETNESNENNDVMVKSFSSFFKAKYNELYFEFRDVVIGLYFSSPAVLIAMGEVETPLFPRGQSLPPLNTDMLESVYSRGEIWRRVDRG